MFNCVQSYIFFSNQQNFPAFLCYDLDKNNRSFEQQKPVL